MSNIKFSFLYRDAANYKTFAEVFFTNPEHIPVDEIRETILNACHVDSCFDPHPWNLPNIRTQPYDPELDHDWYEFVEVGKQKKLHILFSALKGRYLLNPWV